MLRSLKAWGRSTEDGGSSTGDGGNISSELPDPAAGASASLLFYAFSAANLLTVYWFLWLSVGMSLILFGTLDKRGWLEGVMSADDGVVTSDPVV